MKAHPAQASESPAAQGAGAVTLAELRALLTDPYVHLFALGAVVAAAIGAATGSPAFLSGLVLAVGATVVAARDLYEGTVADTLSRVPDRARWLVGRLAAPVVLTAGVTALLAALAVGAGVPPAAAAVEGPATVLLTVQGVCLGLLAGRPAIAVPVLAALWFVLPTALRALGVYLGGDSGVTPMAGWLSPVGLAADLAGWSLVPSEADARRSVGEGVRGAVGLVGWTVVLVVAAWRRLRTRDF